MWVSFVYLKPLLTWSMQAWGLGDSAPGGEVKAWIVAGHSQELTVSSDLPFPLSRPPSANGPGVKYTERHLGLAPAQFRRHGQDQ